ncbi:MAG: response regulator transcription factor [Limnochordia bacterium]|nr:response regulator transcription factor [Limnochordia bacterium]
MTSILIADDDPHVHEILSLYFRKEGYEVLSAYDGQQTLDLVSAGPDLIILDIMMPKLDGWEVCTQLRNQCIDIPIIMLTAKNDDYEKILGFELGTDDYVTKPFNPVEVLERTKAVLRRIKPRSIAAAQDIEVNIEEYSVTVKGQRVELTPRETQLLYYLMVNPSRVFTRDELLEQLWGYDYFGDGRTIDVHIKRIREKIGQVDEGCKQCIKTVWGVGYKFEVTDGG